MALGVIYPIMYHYSSITIPFLLVTSHFCWLQSHYDTIVNAIIIALPYANNSTPAIILTWLLKMAIEIVSFPIKNGGSFHSYVSLPEGIYYYIL